jgi:hypothetical protein
MPNCFTLTRRGADEPESLSTIDEKLCQVLGVPVHPTKYVVDWCSTIGFSLACGKDWDYIENTLRRYADEGDKEDQQALRCCQYLREHYVVNVWCER